MGLVSEAGSLFETLVCLLAFLTSSPFRPSSFSWIFDHNHFQLTVCRLTFLSNFLKKIPIKNEWTSNERA